MDPKVVEERLTILLSHWMEHNRGHAREFVEWGEKAKALGWTAVSEQIVRAAEQMEKANELLQRALEELGDS